MDFKHNSSSSEDSDIYQLQLDEKTKRYKKKLNGFLNKLTNSNFDNVSKKFLTTVKDECISWNYFYILITLIFEKSISELQFFDLYSNLIVVIIKEFPNLSFTGIIYGHNANWNFRHIFLFIIQKQFEKETESECKNVDRLYKLMKLISKFYVNNLLASIIMLKCIETLIARAGRTEKDIEIVCDIFSIAGKKLDLNDVHGKMNCIFEGITCFLVVYNDKPRIIALIENCIDSRNNKWRPFSPKNKFPPQQQYEYRRDGKQHLIEKLYL